VRKKLAYKIALAHLADSRADFYQRRQSLVSEEVESLAWLKKESEVVESDVLDSSQAVIAFAKKTMIESVSALIVHLPTWADPIFTIKLQNILSLPILILGNDRPETSSMVGILGAGGALDQIGRYHFRIFEHKSQESRGRVIAFIRAAGALTSLKGQTLGLFGGRSLGIFTAGADPAQWQRLFGVDIEIVDQLEIVQKAESLDPDEVKRHLDWLTSRLGSIEFLDPFTSKAFERQIRSYLATQNLMKEHGFDFIGVKCQPELSEGYVTQCVAHMLMNGNEDADGSKPAVVHVCESDADGALTMQILQLLSGGNPTGLLDVRWFDRHKGIWTLANCGAMAATFFATEQDPSGFSQVNAKPHAFGKGGGGAYPAVASSQPVTLARLCRKNGEYWMAIISGEALSRPIQELSKTTEVFPQAFIRTSAGNDFIETFGSNHIHILAGEWVNELEAFCRLSGIPFQTWKD
jgi:L-fucose isomerase